MKYDIVVVGAGPAGTSAAAEAAKRGASVIVLEEHSEVGLPIQCGEGFTECEMKRAGFSADSPWVLHRSRGSALVVPSGKRMLSTEPVYSIDRASFDRHLAGEAEKEGALIKTGHRVISAGQSGDGWELKVRSGEREFSVHSALLIGADGPVSVVGRSLGAYLKRKTVVGVGYNVPDASIDDLHHFFFSSKWPDGYAWIFPRGNSYNIGVATSATEPIHLLREFAAEHGIKIEGRFTSGVIPAGYRMAFYSRVFNGAGLLLAGDAAGLTHPITYGGIYPAVMSGRLAGRIAAEALSSGRISDIMRYQGLLRKSDFFVRNAEEVNSAIYSFSDADFNTLGDIVGDAPITDINQGRTALYLILHGKFSLLRRIARIRCALFSGLC